MRLVFAGTPEVALPALRALVNSRHTVAAVVTRPDAPAGRGRRLVASPVAELAAELGIEALKPDRPRDPSFLDRLRAIAPDCCPVVAYGALLPQSALDIPVDVVGEDPQPDPDLRRRQADAGRVEHRLGEVGDQVAQLEIEVNHRLGRSAQHGVTE